MIRVGLVSSLFDVITFAVLLRWFHGDPSLFRTGWFVESLVTQIVVLFVIRTARNPLRSRPSAPLVGTVIAALAIGLSLPFTPVAAALGMVPPPPLLFAYVAGVTVVYLALVEVVKRHTMGPAEHQPGLLPSVGR